MAGDHDSKNPDSILDPSMEPTVVEPNDPLVGQLIGKYQILAHVAEGGTATVYRAIDSVLNREVAIKILHEHLGEKEEVVARFKKEAQYIAQLRHHNILTVFDFFQYQGRAVLVVEFMPGLTLADLIKNSQKVPEDYVLMIGLEIAKGLQAAHEKGIIHRDVKPANVLLNPDLGVKISDFGLAKVSQYDDGLTKAGIFVGTPSFSSPEQIEGKPVDARSDQFSFGLSLYILATRKHAFKQRGDSTTTVWFRTVKGKFDAIRQIDSSLSSDLERITERCLQVDPEKRYPATQDLIRDLEGVLARRGLANYQEHLRAFLRDPQKFVSAAVSPRVLTGVFRENKAKIVAGFVALSVLVLGTWLFVRLDRPPVTGTVTSPQEPQADETPASRQVEPAMAPPAETEQARPSEQTQATQAPEGSQQATQQVEAVQARPARLILPSALPMEPVSRVVLSSIRNQPGYRWTWSDPSTFLLARDSKFANLVVRETDLIRSYDIARLVPGSYYWKAGRESGRLDLEVYKALPNRRLPVAVRSSFGESVEVDLNSWTQNIKLDWTGGPRASAYVLEVASDFEFKQLLFRGALVQTSYLLDRTFTESQKIYWRVSYEDEGRNVFFIEPIRSIQLKIKGFSPRLDLSRTSRSPVNSAKSWRVEVGAPASSVIKCQIVAEGAAVSTGWTSLTKTASSFEATIPLRGQVAYLVCDMRNSNQQTFIVMP